jgi:hypothetical protein
MECDILPVCGFFKKYGISNKISCQALINRYCKGPDMKICKRLEYRKNYGSPPPDEMLPSGLILQENL